MTILEYPPEIRLEILEEKIIPENGFLKIKRNLVKAHYPDGTISEPFEVDSVMRSRPDAVVIVGHFIGDSYYGQHQGERHVWLRSALRPALSFRDYKSSNLLENEYVSNQYELPAGLTESNEIGLEGMKAAATREFEEEVGYKIDPKYFNLLGHRIFPSVGIAGERLFFFEVQTNPLESRPEPLLDGHALEYGGIVTPVPLAEALDLCDKGYLPDAKTEIGLRRLYNKYGTR